jgi:hypothetical protein
MRFSMDFSVAMSTKRKGQKGEEPGGLLKDISTSWKEFP